MRERSDRDTRSQSIFDLFVQRSDFRRHFKNRNFRTNKQVKQRSLIPTANLHFDGMRLLVFILVILTLAFDLNDGSSAAAAAGKKRSSLLNPHPKNSFGGLTLTLAEQKPHEVIGMDFYLMTLLRLVRWSIAVALAIPLFKEIVENILF